MIFVMVGTHHQPFARLVNAMDDVAQNTDETVLIQNGLTDIPINHAEHFDFKPREALRTLCQAARVIVTHAGIGSVIDALQAGKPLIVVPRLKRFGEHTSDHQLELAEAVERRGWGRVIRDIGELDLACAHPPDVYGEYRPARDALIDAVRRIVETTVKNQIVFD